MDQYVCYSKNKVFEVKIDNHNYLVITKHSRENQTLHVVTIPNFDNSMKLVRM